MTVIRFGLIGRATLCLLPLLLSGCLRDIELPAVGACAEYPDPPYDFGGIGVGTCLAAPVEVNTFERGNQLVLAVVNSNNFIGFSSGSVLTMDLTALTEQLDILTAPFETVEPGEPIIPVSIVIKNGPGESEVPDLDDLGVATSMMALPNFAGRIAFGKVGPDDEMDVAFVPSRYSDTTEYSVSDYVYAVDMSDPLDLRPFDVTQGTEAEPRHRFLVKDDPFGVAFVGSDKGRTLYVVNETHHSVSVIDAATFPLGEVTSDAIGLLSTPTFDDVDRALGGETFGEMANLRVAGNTLSDTWHFTYVDGTFRAWYRSDGLGYSTIGLATSGDGVTFQGYSTNPVLEPGDDTDCYASEDGEEPDARFCPWDTDALGRISILTLGGVEYVYYDAYGQDDFGVGMWRIGLAMSTGASATHLSKYDVGENAYPYDDYILGGGISGDFDEAGVSRPWVVQSASEAFALWYVGEDVAGRAQLGVAMSTDLMSWSGRTQVHFYQSYDAESGTYDETDDITEDFAGVTEAAAVWDPNLGRYRLWLTRPVDGGRCLAYAESKTGPSDFKVGALEQGVVGDGCLDLPGGAYIRNPSASIGGRLYHLWYEASDFEDGSDPTRYYARSLDGITWHVVSTPVQLGGDDAWEDVTQSPTIVRASEGQGFRLEGEHYGYITADIPTQSTLSALESTMTFAIVTGHVLGVGEGSMVTSTDEEDGTTSEAYVGTWDDHRVGDPTYDEETGMLYYIGQNGADDTESFFDDLTAIGAATPFLQEGQSIASALQWENAEEPSVGNPTSQSLSGPELVRHQSQALLYFSEMDSSNQIGIRMATEENGVWAQRSGYVLAPDLGESLMSPSVLTPIDGDELWHMWFTVEGSDDGIGYAWSEDGVSWTRETELVRFDSIARGDWDDVSKSEPSVVRLFARDGSVDGYLMWYTGYSGTVYRIGVASAAFSSSTNLGSLQWTRHQGLTSGEPRPVVYGTSEWWDRDGVRAPEVTWTGDRYRMWYEGWRGSNHRIGLAESWDGTLWTQIYAPLTPGDVFSFRTAKVAEGSETDDATGSSAQLVDGSISLYQPVNANCCTGVGASEITVSPDGSIAVLGVRHSGAVYVLDIRDDSTDLWYDANFNGIEAMLTWTSNNDTKETRSVVFHPSGERFYMTTAHPDSVMVFDRTKIADKSAVQILDDTFLGGISLEPGVIEDQGNASSVSADIGAIGLAITRSGRYLWVANANANSVYTIDLELGTFGEVVTVAKNVGELPVALTLSPDEKYLFVANYMGEVVDSGDEGQVSHGTLAVIDADPTSSTFGKTVAKIKNLML